MPISAPKYFCDMDGLTLELTGIVYGMPNAEFAAKFPGVKGRRYDSFSMRTARAEDGRYLPITRTIFYKTRPSKHTCDARCMYAKGRTMNCECSCGGKNHGRGGFSCN